MSSSLFQGGNTMPVEDYILTARHFNFQTQGKHAIFAQEEER